MHLRRPGILGQRMAVLALLMERAGQAELQRGHLEKAKAEFNAALDVLSVEPPRGGNPAPCTATSVSSV